jgi:hypothetical protein
MERFAYMEVLTEVTGYFVDMPLLGCKRKEG